MISEKKSGAPYLNVWFGNFYRPAYDDQAFVAEGMELLKKLGFNSVLLDSKDWEDFRERYEGKPASQFVGMQEFMMEQIKKQGMSHTFLAIYLNADNLYPNIRFSPPVFGESVVTAKGNDGRWYRYWSEKAQETMTEHVSQLLEMYGENMTRIEVDGEEKNPLCSMWDPVVAPSFDEDGKNRYRSWLEKRYNGDIETFNRFYKTEANSFETIEPEQYWFELRYPGKNGFSEKELKDRDEKCRVWMDNQRWKSDELVLYFEAMQKKLHALDPQLYLCPDLSQWGYFLNVDGSFLNGAGLYDYKEKKMLWRSTIGEKGRDFVKLVEKEYNKFFKSVDIGIYFDDYVYIVKNGLFASATMHFDKAHFEVVKSIDDVPKDGWMKVIFWSNPITIKSLQKFIDKNENPDANFMSSSVCTIEMLQKGTHKGVGIMKLADMLGIDKSHVAAIGDYYNDWDMLKTVGLPACAGQAPAPIHNICKFEACHCNKGCVADLLEYIMSGKAEEDIKKENNKK